MRLLISGQLNNVLAPVDGNLLATELRAGPAQFFVENVSTFAITTGLPSLGESVAVDGTPPAISSYTLAAGGLTSVQLTLTVSDALTVSAGSVAHIPASVLLPELSEFPASRLNEDLFNGFAVGQYDVLGSRLLEDHIGYDISRLASLSSLGVKLGPDMPGAIDDWAAWLLVRPASNSCNKSGGIL